jgi:hypothetical protein
MKSGGMLIGGGVAARKAKIWHQHRQAAANAKNGGVMAAA